MERNSEIKLTMKRKDIMNNAICYHKDLKEAFKTMPTKELMAHTHPSFRAKLENSVNTW